MLPSVLPPELVASSWFIDRDFPCTHGPHHNHHNHHKTGPSTLFLGVRLCERFRELPMMDEPSCRPRQVDGAAKRRRQQTVAAVLATVSHHSYPKVDTAHDGLRAQRTVTSTREEEVDEKHDGPRAEKPPLPGMRLGLPPEPELQVRAATVGCVAAAGPLLVPPVLGGGDTLDDATISFLLAQSLLERQELQETEDAAKRREETRLKRQTVEVAKAPRGRRSARWRGSAALLLRGVRCLSRGMRLTTLPPSSSSSGKRRKRKNRRKKKTLETSSSRAVRCHEFGGVWIFVSSWYVLASTAQRQFRIGLCLQLVSWG